MSTLLKIKPCVFLVLFITSIGIETSEAQITWKNAQDIGGFDYWHVSNSWNASAGLTVPNNTTGVIFDTAPGAVTPAFLDAGQPASSNEVSFVTFNGSSNYTISPFGGTPTLNIHGTVTNNSSVTQIIGVNTSFVGARIINSTGAGQTTFSGTVGNTTGGLTVSRTGAGATGNILFSNNVNLGTNSLTTNNNNATGTVSFNSIVTAGSVVNQGSGTTNYSTITAPSISNSGSGLVNVAGAVTSSGNPLVISKSSTGSINFGGTVTATGSTISITNVGTGGAVSFNGTVTANSVSVSGNRLQGTGTINAATTIGSSGSYSAGNNGVGSQTLTGLNFSDSSNFVWDLNNTGVNNVGGDLVNVGSLSVGSGFLTQINLTGSAVTVGQFWDVFNSTTALSATSISNLLSGTFLHSAPPGIGFQWSLENGNTIGRITAVPEPSSMALLGMAGLIGGVYARRRAKKAKA